MFVNQLRLTISAQQNTEIIEPSDDPLQLHTVDKKNRYGNLGFSNVIQESVLKVLSV